jgi:RimJ/RimL family protein N-acetyltransferase
MYLPPGLVGEIANERQTRMLAEAEADRRRWRVRQAARQARKAARPSRPTAWPARRAGGPVTPRRPPVLLRDGSLVHIRPVQESDAPLLAEGFGRLSDRSRWMRFLMAKQELSPAELRYFTTLDHHDHEALGAVDHSDGRGVAIARYIRHPAEPEAAEIALTVADDWQRRGLGTELLTRLADRACQEGIRTFTALVAADNTAMSGLLDNLSAHLVRQEPDTLTYELVLGCVGRSCG